MQLINSVKTKCKLNAFLVIALFFQFIVLGMMFFNIPVARQILGFIYFTFIPGLLIIKLLKLDTLDILEIILFSVGLSIAFLMLAGLGINELAFFFGLSEPLSPIVLMLILNILILIIDVLVYLKDMRNKLRSCEFHLPFRLTWVFVCLPILSAAGANLANTSGNNVLLLFVIIVISFLFVIFVFLSPLLSSKTYYFIVLIIAISLLYHSSLISNYITPYGSDAAREHFIFKNTQDKMYWVSTNPYDGDIQNGRIHSMLSVTILPTIYSNLLNIDSTGMFKLIFPIIFSLVPLSLFHIWKRYLENKYAFISAFLFMSYGTFYGEMLGLNRQMIAELFFVLLLIVVLNQKMNSFKKTALFMIFSVSLIVSHYGLALIFLFIILLSFFTLFLFRKPSKNVSLNMIMFFSVVMFLWYIFTSGSAGFNTLLMFGNNIYCQLSDFFNPASRQEMVLRGIGLETPPTILSAISRALAYITELLISIGFISLITRRIKINMDRYYFALSVIAMSFLVILILVPGLAATMNITRFYHILLFFLAPLCPLGAYAVSKKISKQKKELLTTIMLIAVLVPYFLFQTSFIYETTGEESWSLPLSKYRISTYKLYLSFTYIFGDDVYSAQWVSKNIALQKIQIYADVSSRPVLLGYGMIPLYKVITLTNTTDTAKMGMVYLNRLNVEEGIIIDFESIWNLTDFSFYNDLSKIYSNGWSEVYKNMSQ